MKARLIALLSALAFALSVGAVAAPPASANGDFAWCDIFGVAPVKSGNYIVGGGRMVCNGSDITGWRIQVVLQDANGNNIAGTASGWIYTPSYTYVAHTAQNNSSFCLNTHNKVYRTEIQASATHRLYGYSGIHYAYTDFVTRACGISGYS